MNNTEMEGHSDYLTMLNTPDSVNLALSSGPEYVNGSRMPEDRAAAASTSGYLPIPIKN